MCCCCCCFRQSFYVLSPRPDHVGITSRGAARSRRHHLRRPQPSPPEPRPQPPEPQPPESQPPEPQAAGAAVVVATAAGAAVPPEPLERPWVVSKRFCVFALRAAAALAERCLKPDPRNCAPSGATVGARMDNVMGQWTSFDVALAPHCSRKLRSNSGTPTIRSPHEEPRTTVAWPGH